MDEKTIEALIDNEKEWRRFIVNELEVITVIQERISKIEAWNLVFRIIGAVMFALLLAMIETGFSLTK